MPKPKPTAKEALRNALTATPSAHQQAITLAVCLAVEEEREACALLVNPYHSEACDMIRARNPRPKASTK